MKLRYEKSGVVVDLELKGEKEEVEYFLEKILSLIDSSESIENNLETYEEEVETSRRKDIEVPNIKIERGDKTSTIIKKLFSTEWGRKPRELREVVETLHVLGHYVGKTTVAVTLKRLVQRGELRRIRGSDKIYRYVSAYPT